VSLNEMANVAGAVLLGIVMMLIVIGINYLEI
jgi:hypothetical protein